MRKHLLLSILLVWSVSIYAQQAKYVFYFIGDGMGINQVQGTEIYRAELKKKNGNLPFIIYPISLLYYCNHLFSEQPCN